MVGGWANIFHTATRSMKTTRIIANIRPTRRDEPTACVCVTAGWDAMVEQTRNASR